MRIRVLQIPDAEIETWVIDALRQVFEVEILAVTPISGLGTAEWGAGSVVDRMAHTPEPLIESWKVAQTVLSLTSPGDVVVVTDERGVGGILALGEAMKSPQLRRQIWTVAAESTLLESLLVHGTIDHAGMPEASEIDWELTQYRFSADVLASSAFAVHALDGLGIEAGLLSAPPKDSRPTDEPHGEGVWAPAPVSRRNQSGDVLRAVAGVPDLPITVSAHDVEDKVWTGTTWDALSGVREVLGNRLSRATQPASKPAVVVVGEILRAPEASVQQWWDAGVRVVVPEGSVASAMFPDAATWETSDELAQLLVGGSADRESIPSTLWTRPAPIGVSDSQRATRVSVGVPIFRNAEYLDECVSSILNQTSPPHEILLIDDGSNSTAIDESLVAWATREPDLVRILRGPNRGVCVARNLMIEAMLGDAFLLVDQDDILAPEFIEKTSEAMRYDDSLWAVAVWNEFFGEYEGIEAKPPFDRRVGLRENPIVSTAALVDMRVRDEGILFEPDLAFLYCEDWHYWSQIVAAGGRLGLVPQPLIKHRVHHASGGFQRTELAHRIGTTRAIEPLRRYSPPR
jgi:GT2 family glycosyltransferase